MITQLASSQTLVALSLQGLTINSLGTVKYGKMKTHSNRTTSKFSKTWERPMALKFLIN